MNVLVYSGPGVSQTSLNNTISTLRLLLRFSYAVQPVSPEQLISHPWQASCALLVIPGGRDLPYLSSLSKAIDNISRYIRQGGSYLGICAGAYFASGRVEWELGTPLEVVGERPLKFFSGTSRGCVFPGFQYESENGARTVSLGTQNDTKIRHGLYYNGGGEFVIKPSHQNIYPLGHYLEEGEGAVAGVHCRVEKGNAVLWHVHIEYPTTSAPVLEAAKRVSNVSSSAELTEAESERLDLFRETLTLLGISLPKRVDQAPSSTPLPQFLCSNSSGSKAIDSLVFQLRSLCKPGTQTIEDANDTFEVHHSSSAEQLLSSERTRSSEDSVRKLIIYENGSTPSDDLTPHFSLPRYFKLLEMSRKASQKPTPHLACSIGDLILYGETIPSTQTLLERNIKSLEVLPAPLLSLATYQLSARGRGSNVWISALGGLQFSLLLRVPPTFPSSKLVFIQYLMGIAVVNACREVMGSLGEAIVLKWPNDIYAKVKSFSGGELRKIGGILINTVFMAGGVRIIAGCGLNVHNEPPILSLSQLESQGPGSNPKLTMENMTATIMSIFGAMWDEFVAANGSFEPFMDLYLDRWIHSDQLVTLETTTPPTRVRIMGITPDHGLLRTTPEAYKPGQFIDLQPDGNSFDMMAGLIKTKR